MGLQLGIEKVTDAISAMPQSAVGNNDCYEWGRDQISRGLREPQGFLKLIRAQRQLGGLQSSRKASEAAVRVS